jgi:hypothetical protein
MLKYLAHNEVGTPVAPLGANPSELSHLGLPISTRVVESQGAASLRKSLKGSSTQLDITYG